MSDSVVRSSAQEIVAFAAGGFGRVEDVGAVGGGVARVRDELHGLAEVGLVVVEGG